MPAVADPPTQVQAPPTPQDGGFAERLGQTIHSDPNAARLPGFKVESAPPTPEKTLNAPTGLETGKKDPPEVIPPIKDEKKVESKASASDLLKNLAKGEQKVEDKTLPPTPEQKKEYTMKELRLRAEKADTLEKELATVREEIASAKALGATPDQLKALTEERDAIKAEREDYKKKLAAVDVMQSDNYIDNVTKPMEAIWKGLKKDSEEFKFSWEGLTTALNITDHRQRLSAIAKVLDNAVQKDSESGEMVPLDSLNKNDIVNAVTAFVERDYYGRQLLADADKTQGALKAEKEKKESLEKETRKQTFTSQADHVFKQMFSEEALADMPFLGTKDGDGKFTPDKTLLDSIRKAAADDSTDPWKHSLKSYALELLPVVMEYAKKNDTKITELEERIGKLSGAGPKGGGAITHEDGGNPDDKLSMAERLAKIQKSQGLNVNLG